jgi:hypothetical protein
VHEAPRGVPGVLEILTVRVRDARAVAVRVVVRGYVARGKPKAEKVRKCGARRLLPLVRIDVEDDAQFVCDKSAHNSM